MGSHCRGSYGTLSGRAGFGHGTSAFRPASKQTSIIKFALNHGERPARPSSRAPPVFTTPNFSYKHHHRSLKLASLWFFELMTQISETRDIDEISLADIVAKVWRGRGWIVLYAAVGVVVAAILITISAVTVNRPALYFIDLNGITDERYPGGAAFSPQNLLAPEVLSEVRRRFNLATDVKLREAITVSYGSPITGGLQKYYQRRLEARNLSQVDLAAINAEYQRELLSATQSSLQIEVNYSLIGLDAASGIAIARALPVIWTEVYATRFNIFADERLTPVSLSKEDETMDSVASVLVVDAALKTMRNGLTLLSTDNRFSAIVTEDGLTVSALRERIKVYDLIYFSPIKAYAFQAKDSVGTTYLYTTRQRLAELQRNVSQYDSAIDKLVRPRSMTTIPGDVTGAGTVVSKDGLQLGDSGITEIINLADRASSNALVQEMFKKREELSLEASAIQRDLDIITGSQEVAGLTAIRTSAVSALRDLITHYNELLGRANQTLRQQFKTLHTPVSGPLVPGSFLPGWAVLALFASGAAGGLVGLFVALFWSQRRTAD